MSRALVRRWVAGVGYGLGVTQAITRAGDRWQVIRRGRFSIGPRQQTPFLVLLYHRVNRRPGTFSIERTTPESFRGQMTYLARNFHVMALAEIVRRVEAGEPLPPRVVAVTFDDGYEDNYTDAFPILHELGLPATIFLTTGCIGTGTSLWYDRVICAFEHTSKRRVSLPGAEDATGLNDPRTRAREATRALYALMRLSNEERLKAQERLIDELGGTGDGSSLPAMLTWEQVRVMAVGGIDFGAHTVSHPILTRLPTREAEREMTESRKAIEERLGRAVDLFAYPVGRRSEYSQEVVDAVARSGFRAALTTDAGTNLPGDDMLLLRRLKPLGEDVPSFALGLGAQYLSEWRAAG